MAHINVAEYNSDRDQLWVELLDDNGKAHLFRITPDNNALQVTLEQMYNPDGEPCHIDADGSAFGKIDVRPQNPFCIEVRPSSK